LVDDYKKIAELLEDESDQDSPARDLRFEKWRKKNTRGKIARYSQKLGGHLPHNNLMTEPAGNSKKGVIKSNWKVPGRPATDDSKAKSVKFDYNNDMSDFSPVIPKRSPKKKKSANGKRRMTIERSALESSQK
jgi:hypothetical protein